MYIMLSAVVNIPTVSFVPTLTAVGIRYGV